MPTISIRGNEMPASPIRKLAPLADAAKQRGVHVFHLNIGQPDLPTPQAAIDAIRNIDRKVLEYSPSAGYRSYREKLVGYYAKFNINLTADDIIITSGGSEAVLFSFLSCLNPGDEIIVPEPAYANYMAFAISAGAKIRTIATTIEEGFSLPKVEKFEELINERTKAILICNPNNPTGVVYSDATLKEIARILIAKEEEFGTDIYLISDEPYRELVYDGVQENFLTKYYKDTLVGYSFSKSLSLPGERIGYVVVPDEAADSAELIEGITVSNRTLGFVNAPSLIQKAVAECLKEKTNLEFYDRNRIALYEGLTKLGFTCIKPQGAFYLWLKSPVAKEEEFVEAAKKYHLILVKGSAFGYGGYVRLAYCTSYETVVNSMQAFAKLAAEYGLKAAE